MAKKRKPRPPWRPEAGSEDAMFAENPRAAPSRARKAVLTPRTALALFNAEKDKYLVATGLKSCSVYRRVSPLPGNNDKRKSLFTSKDVSGAQEWIERRAMGVIVRAARVSR